MAASRADHRTAVDRTGDTNDRLIAVAQVVRVAYG